MLLRAVSGQFSLNTYKRPQRSSFRDSCTIYGIFDPRDGDVRYIGKSIGKLEYRWRIHQKELRDGKHNNIRLLRLYNKLERLGLGNLCCLPIAYYENDELPDAEVRWIARARRQGFDICNVSNGGGLLGYKHTEETKRKISEIKMGRKKRWTSPEARELFIKRQRERIPSEKQLAALARGRTDPDVVTRNREAVRAAGRQRKGRIQKETQGENNRNASLTDAEVLSIRADYSKLGKVRGACAKLAKKYCSSIGVIWCVVKGHTWKHLLGKEV